MYEEKRVPRTRRKELFARKDNQRMNMCMFEIFLGVCKIQDTEPSTKDCYDWIWTSSTHTSPACYQYKCSWHIKQLDWMMTNLNSSFHRKIKKNSNKEASAADQLFAQTYKKLQSSLQARVLIQMRPNTSAEALKWSNIQAYYVLRKINSGGWKTRNIVNFFSAEKISGSVNNKLQ